VDLQPLVSCIMPTYINIGEDAHCVWSGRSEIGQFVLPCSVMDAACDCLISINTLTHALKPPREALFAAMTTSSVGTLCTR